MMTTTWCSVYIGHDNKKWKVRYTIGNSGIYDYTVKKNDEQSTVHIHGPPAAILLNACLLDDSLTVQHLLKFFKHELTTATICESLVNASEQGNLSCARLLLHGGFGIRGSDFPLKDVHTYIVIKIFLESELRMIVLALLLKRMKYENHAGVLTLPRDILRRLYSILM